MSIILIENIETDLKMSVDDVMHVLKTLRKDIDAVKSDVEKLKRSKPKRVK